MRVTVEEKNVILVEVDTLKNDANSLTKSVGTENYYWCRETIGIISLYFFIMYSYNPLHAKKMSEKMLGIVISFARLTCLDHIS